MPNHCWNSGTIRTSSKEVADEIAKHVERGTFLNYIAPTPEEFMTCHSGGAGYVNDDGKEQTARLWFEIPYIAGLGWSRGWIEKPGYKSYRIPNRFRPFRKLAPVTQEKYDEWVKKYGAAGWYDWNCKHRGTKWDIWDGCVDEEIHGIPKSDDHTVDISFITAWSPPCEAYEKLWEREEITSISMYYEESGMGFCGDWEDGTDDCRDYVDEEDYDE